MSAVEIEDVLSSIRRLVSEDLRPLARSGTRAGKGAALGAALAEPGGAKLILTPALRVVPETEPVAETAGIEQVVASVSAAVGAQSGEWESETGDAEEMQAAAPVDWFVLTPGDEAEAKTAGAEEAVVAAAAGEVLVPVGRDASEAVPGWAQEEAPEAEEDAAAEVLAGAVELDAGPADEVGADEVGADEAPADEAWADAVEAQVLAELEDRAADAAGALDGDAIYEEEVLRALVRDIIREELQGDLGERITRNIRKLVRAEIGRALAAQALE